MIMELEECLIRSLSSFVINSEPVKRCVDWIKNLFKRFPEDLVLITTRIEQIISSIKTT